MTTTPYASLPPSEVGAVGESVLAWLHRLAQLPPERLASEALQRLRYELDLPGDDFRRCMLQRLRGLLLLEPADALRIAHASEDAAGTLDEWELHELRQVEEDAVLDGLSFAEFRRLEELIPSLRRLSAGSPLQKSSRDGTFLGSLAAADLTAEV